MKTNKSDLFSFKNKSIMNAFIHICMFILLSCTGEDEGKDKLAAGTEISDNSILVDMGIKVNGDIVTLNTVKDLGEFVKDTDPKSITININNRSSKEYTDINLSMNNVLVRNYNFHPNNDGDNLFPGLGGTCTRTLASGSECTIVLTFSSSKSEVSIQNFDLTYNNLIGPRRLTFGLKYLSGSVAKLIFSGDVGTQFKFGQLIGAGEKPVIERSVASTYSKSLVIENTGELSARNISFSNAESCRSTFDNTCPAGFKDVYTFTHDCPTRLFSGETCELVVDLSPKNQDPLFGAVPDNIKEILYSSTFTTNYGKDPENTTAALNGYFSSFSTQIEATFDVTINSLDFPVILTVGNRDKKALRIVNKGYREGRIKSLNILDSSDTLLGKCIKPNGLSDLLYCYDTNLTTQLTLEDLPFFLKDRSNCIAPIGDTEFDINVEGVCLFDLVFQPSVAYLTDRNFDIKLEVEFDSRWKGEVHIVNNFLLSSLASSISAAQIDIDGMTFDTNPVTTFTDNNGVRMFDLGRLALLSQNFPFYRPLVFSMNNNGSTSATDTIIKDGSGRLIPHNDDNPSGVSLGVNDPKYFRSTSSVGNGCRVINGSCSFVTNFAPFGLATPELNDQNMFDNISGPIKYKSFILEYEDGSLYSDNNRDTDTKDIAKKVFETRLTAALITKGLLQDVTVTNSGRDYSPSNIVAGDTSDFTLLIRNIGTGPVSYLGNTASITSLLPSTELVATLTPAAFGANHDCLDIIDFGYSLSDEYNDIMARSASWSSLGVEDVCALTYRSQLKNNSRSEDVQGVTIEEDFGQMARYFNLVDLASNSDELWEFPAGSLRSDIALRWHDGDTTDPALTALATSDPVYHLGVYRSTGSYRAGVRNRTPAKIIPASAYPLTSAVIYRQSYVRPQLDYMGTMVHASDTIPELYIFGPGNETIASESSHKAVFSKTHAAGRVNNNYDYSIHFGSFPTGRAFPLQFLLHNAGENQGTISSISWDSQDATITNVIGLSSGLIGSLGNQEITFDFQASAAGQYESILSVTYNNGLSNKTFKIQILADALLNTSIPTLSAKVANFSLGLSDYNPPVETENVSSTVVLADNHQMSNETVVFEYVKNNSINANSGYEKKRLYFENNTAFNMNMLSIVIMGNYSNFNLESITASGNIVIENSTCTADMTLNSLGGNCYIDIKYQPDENSEDKTFFIGGTYEVDSNQYIMRHYKLDFLAKEPSKVIPVGLISNNISVENGVVLPSAYHLDPGGVIRYDEYPYELTFNFQLSNASTTTKASLLKTYHDWRIAEGDIGVSNTLRPSEPADYNFYDNGRDYAIIHKSYYSDMSERFIVRANKACLVGDDDEGDDFRNGFFSMTSEACYLYITLSLDMSYLARSLDLAEPLDMAGNYLRLPYYSNLRSSIDYINIYFLGTIKPDLSIKDDEHIDVQAFSNGKVTFDWNDMDANNASVGSIVGYRVFLSDDKTSLDSNLIFNGTDNYYDSMTSDIEIDDSLVNGQRYHMLIYPIRSSPNYAGPPTGVTVSSFDGLASNQYISESDISILSVVIPPFGQSYLHTEQVIISEDLEDYNPKTFEDAKDICINKFPLLITDGSNAYPTGYKLLKASTWDIIAADTTLDYSSYTNGLTPVEMPHWLDEGVFSITSELTGVTGFNSASSSQDLSDDGFYYIRDSECFSCSVPMARGGLYGSTSNNLTLFIDPSVALPVTRCLVDLGSLP